MNNDRGFSLVELIVIVAVIGVIAAMATPLMVDVADGMRLGSTARELERELQTARLKSVQTNRPLRLRTNCPVAGQYRIVEFLGNSNPIDTDANRCNATTYPFPADNNPLTRPNFDGPVRRGYLGVTMTNAIVEFRPDGTAYQVAGGVSTAIVGTGVVITLTKKTQTRSVTINGLGKIQLK